MNPTLKSFVDYMEKNPTLRFWQALAAWSGYNMIYISKSTIWEMTDPLNELVDTYYFEGKNQ